MHGSEREEVPPPREAPEKVEKARSFCAELLSRLGASLTPATASDQLP